MMWTSGIDGWGLSARELDASDASELSKSTFRSHHVAASKPLCIRNATGHWPAFANWTDADYLSATLGRQAFTVHETPVMEMKWRKTVWPDAYGDAAEDPGDRVISFQDLQALAHDNTFVFAYAVDDNDAAGLSGLAGDVAHFGFLGRPRRPHYYAPLRYFLHGRSYTDWHYHPYDETLMCQFGPSKRVTLLPPTQETWDILVGVAKQEQYLGAADVDRHPDLRALKPIQIEVHSGDAIYIPPHWWHAVECPETDGQLGVTLAYCWRSPLHVELNPAFPYKKFMRKYGDLRRKVRLGIENVGWAGLTLAGQRP